MAAKASKASEVADTERDPLDRRLGETRRGDRTTEHFVAGIDHYDIHHVGNVARTLTLVALRDDTEVRIPVTDELLGAVLGRTDPGGPRAGFLEPSGPIRLPRIRVTVEVEGTCGRCDGAGFLSLPSDTHTGYAHPAEVCSDCNGSGRVWFTDP